MKDKTEFDIQPEIGFWLGFLIFQMLVLSPLLGAVSLNHELDLLSSRKHLFTDWEQYENSYWIAFSIFTILLWAVSYQLLECLRWKSIRLTVLALWVIPVSWEISNFIISYIYMTAPSISKNPIVYESMISGLLAKIIWAVVWTAYLLKSKIVRARYK